MSTLVGASVQGRGVREGSGVRLGSRARVGSRVRLGSGVRLGSRVRLGSGLRVGSIVREGSGVPDGQGVSVSSGVSLPSGVALGSSGGAPPPLTTVAVAVRAGRRVADGSAVALRPSGGVGLRAPRGVALATRVPVAGGVPGRGVLVAGGRVAPPIGVANTVTAGPTVGRGWGRRVPVTLGPAVA